MGLTSLKQLEEAIKNTAKAFEMLLRYASKKNFILTASRLHTLKESIENVETSFDAFKKQCVCIPTKQLPHKIVCLVGSTRSECQGRYRMVNRELCLKGYVVVTVSLFKTDVEDIEKHRNLLESIHFQKIHLSDIVVLIHKDAIGTHTAMELEYCKKIGKPTVTFNNIEQTDREIKDLLEDSKKKE